MDSIKPHVVAIATSFILTSLVAFMLWIGIGFRREAVQNWQAYASCSDSLNFVQQHILTQHQKWKLADKLAKEASRGAQ